MYQSNKYRYLFISKSEKRGFQNILLYLLYTFVFIRVDITISMSILRYGPLYTQYHFPAECFNIAHFLKIAMYTIMVHQRDL